MVNTPFIGQKDRHLTIFETQTVVNSIGEEKETPIEKYKAHAHLVRQNSSEDMEGKIIHLIDRVYQVRWRRDLEINGFKYLLSDQGEKFRIETVIPLGRRNHLELVCKRYE